MPFPPDFAWGTATSSYQIEGAVDEDGRGRSIWDTFSHTPGRVADGATGDVACDHYHRWADDVDLIGSYGLNAYRFSIAWPRIQPDGRGAANQRGLDFYRRLVDRLTSKGIRPAATLYHWDLPQALQDDGAGWQNRETAARFAEYAEIVYGALGEGVAWWITHNEPWCTAALGHRLGIHAPGFTDTAAELRTAHHVLLSHGLAVEAYRASGLAAPIGITLNLMPTYPQDDTDADGRAAVLSDGYTNRWYLDPVFHGSYPADMLDYFGERWRLDWIRDGDLARTAQPIDFLGVNYYSRRVVRAPRPGEAAEFAWVVRSEGTTGIPTSDLGWEMTPDTFLDLLVRLRADYGSPPIYVTENGCSLNDVVADDGGVHDPRRIEFFRTHLAAVEEAIARGVDVRGYFAWSLMDNFEWAEGYGPRFGITYVDYATQRRIPKDSALWYAEVVHRNGLP
ncbi:MAG: GH1 family beta-glucosidase [Chloroflexota bacterium]|nr:GH1 family beta-glucosidase [Chloroflexota bacterium]